MTRLSYSNKNETDKQYTHIEAVVAVLSFDRLIVSSSILRARELQAENIADCVF